VAYFSRYRYTPYSMEQGIISSEQGNYLKEQGILRSIRNSPKVISGIKVNL
jgi:hypothetical protein